MPLRDFLIFLAICVAWALNTIVSKLVVTDMAVPPLFYAAVRTLVVGALLYRYLFPMPAQIWRVCVVTLLVGGGGFALIFIGLQTATPSSAAVVILSQTPLTILFAVLLLGEKVGIRRFTGMLLTLAGVLVVLFDPVGMHGSIGLIFVGLCALAGSLGSVMLKQLPTEPIRLQAWGGVSSSIVLIPISLLLEKGQWTAMGAAGWHFVAALLFSAVVVSVIAHTTYYGLLQRYDANMIAPLTLMTPILTIAFGALITGDPIGWRLIAGALLAVGGVMIIAIRPSRTLPKWLIMRDL
ncbi:DMT family transporter [Sphingobium sp. Z007]|uniref:DMT family transporter n=1 Tax=Sphingobium sp. Z007 TaxID=627495 RepID=UPI000B49D0EE|nr:DMT family transporter [Sphingobium sp. Z007]